MKKRTAKKKNVTRKNPGESSKSTSSNKPSRRLEDSSLPEIGKKEYSEIIAKHGKAACEHFYAGEDADFDVGDEVRAARKELLGTGKRVPNDTYVARSMSSYLRGQGIRDASPSTVYDWMRASETREALGGKSKAPRRPISHYVVVSRNAIPMEQRREFLLEALHNNLSTSELKGRVLGKFKDEIGPKNGDDVALTELEGLEHALNQARSILTNTFVSFDCSKRDESMRWTIGSLENLAVYIWQFRDDLESGAAGGKS